MDRQGKEREVELKILRTDPGIPLPRYMSDDASGMDLYAAEDVVLEPGRVMMVDTGLRVAIPSGFELQIRPRSSLGLQGIGVINAPGTIDADYRGPIKILLINLGCEIRRIQRGDRIAQAVVCPVYRARMRLVDVLPSSTRGEGGFGHTGGYAVQEGPAVDEEHPC